MQICNYRSNCDAHRHERHFHSRGGLLSVVDRMRIRRWLRDAAVPATLHYNTEKMKSLLSCVTLKTLGFICVAELVSNLTMGRGCFCAG